MKTKYEYIISKDRRHGFQCIFNYFFRERDLGKSKREQAGRKKGQEEGKGKERQVEGKERQWRKEKEKEKKLNA